MVFPLSQCSGSPKNCDHNRSNIPPDDVPGLSRFAEQDQFSREINHGVEEDDCQCTAAGIIIDPGEGQAQRYNAEEKEPER